MRFDLLPPVDRRVKRSAISPTVWLLLLFLWAVPALQAQEIRPLDKKVNFSTRNGSLREALGMLRTLSGASITFNDEEIDKQPRITLHLTNETVRRILEKILVQTSLQYIEDDNGGVILSPRRNKKDQVRSSLGFIVDGQVVDRKGIPLFSASIQVVGEKYGTTTDPNGLFRTLVAEGMVLRVSYQGMKTVDRAIKGRDFVRIMLDTVPAVMNEYVITGYQNIDKRMLTSSVYTLTPDKFMESGVPSVSQMLQGKVPGLVLTNTSGSPSATPKIRIRGTSTILGNASPVWVVDGIIREDPVDLNPLQINAALQDAQSANFSIVGNAIAGLNPYDIESITFLKDASATAIYGVRAANGVIVVKTKRGKVGPVSVSYNTSMGFTGRPTYKNIDAMNSRERIDVSREAAEKGTYYADYPLPNSYEGLVQQLYTRGITQEQFDLQVAHLETMNTDWLKILAQNKFNQSHSIGISGGAGRTTYYASLGYQDYSGTYQGDNTKLYSMLVNVDGAINNKFSFSLHMDASYRTADGFYKVNPNDYALKTSRTISADSPYVNALYRPAVAGGVQSLHYSILNELAQTGNTSSGQGVNAAAVVSYRILPGLTYSGTFGGSLSYERAFTYASERSYYIATLRGYDYGTAANGSPLQKWSAFPFGGIGNPSSTSGVGYTARNQLDYNHNFFGGRDQISITAIQELSSAKADGVTTMELGYYPDRGDTYYSSFYATLNPNPLLRHTVQTTNKINNTMSWAGSASYRFKRRYTINANIRTDGNNRFGQYANQKFLPNWSVSGRWDLSEEPWMVKSDILSGCEIHVSYGTQGNVVSQVGPNLIATYPQSPVDPGTNEYILNLQSLPYPGLRWEKTRQLNVGTSLNLFNGHVMLGADGFFKNSKELLVAKNIPEEYGVQQMYMNYGSMKNYGWDGNLTINAIRQKNFSWTQTFIYSQNFNTVTKSDLRYTYGDYLAGNAIITGKPLGALYSYAFTGLSHQYGIPQYNLGGTGAKGADPTTFLAYTGRRDPLVDIGTSTMLRYKRLSLIADFHVVFGNYKRLNPIYNSMAGSDAGLPGSIQNLPKELAGRWRNPGDEQHTNIPAFTNWYQQSGYQHIPTLTLYPDYVSPYNMYDLSTARVVNGSFVRCKSLTLNYLPPASVLKGMGIKGASISAGVNNPFIIKSKGMHWQDPEVDNIGGTALPITASYYLTMNVTL